jgi:hypothetical protein
MCTTAPTTLRNVEPAVFRGLACPVCAPDQDSRLDYMRFLDPHGVERVDREILECSRARHVFRTRNGQLLLVASEGTRIHPPRRFVVAEGGGLQESSAA